MANTAATYAKKIKALTTPTQLQQLWSGIQSGNTPGWPKGKAFEYLVIRAFDVERVPVRYPYEVPGNNGTLEQIDGAVHLDFISFLIESKDFSKKKTNIEPVAKLDLRLQRRPSGTLGVLFSRNGLTDLALEIGIPRNLLLWQGNEIDVAIRNPRMRDGLVIKYRHSIEDGVRDYNLLREGWP
jgi:hypothetical protein